MAVLLVFVVAFALGYGAYRISRNGFRYPQSEKLSGFGVFGYFIFILFCIWLVGNEACCLRVTAKPRVE